ncbi:MAG: pilus assembly protein N-terminal domain-containing protein [Candidatus Obscuribacterales bacterium]|nr:pilus assembly protein N-terminal domain-containing protein [Candidatus Obscuribacterales bacterium]
MGRFAAIALVILALCHLSADKAVSQGEPSQPVARETTGIPTAPVDSATPSQELVSGGNILLTVAQSRVLKMKSKIVAPSVIDAGIAELVSTSGNELLIRGRLPGTTTLVLSDESGTKSFIEVRVERQLTAEEQQQPHRSKTVKFIPVGGSDRIILTGDVGSNEELIKLFGVGNASTDDRGMNIEAANNRVIKSRPGEQGSSQR